MAKRGKFKSNVKNEWGQAMISMRSKTFGVALAKASIGVLDWARLTGHERFLTFGGLPRKRLGRNFSYDLMFGHFPAKWTLLRDISIYSFWYT